MMEHWKFWLGVTEDWLCDLEGWKAASVTWSDWRIKVWLGVIEDWKCDFEWLKAASVTRIDWRLEVWLEVIEDWECDLNWLKTASVIWIVLRLQVWIWVIENLKHGFQWSQDGKCTWKSCLELKWIETAVQFWKWNDQIIKLFNTLRNKWSTWEAISWLVFMLASDFLLCLQGLSWHPFFFYELQEDRK